MTGGRGEKEKKTKQKNRLSVNTEKGQSNPGCLALPLTSSPLPHKNILDKK